MVEYSTDASVYRVGSQMWSIHDLLARFAERSYFANGISRLSDMHLKVSEPVRYRFDSELHPLPEAAPLTPEVLEQLLFPLLREEQREDLRLNRTCDLDAAYEWGEQLMSFRINAFRDREGLACAIRVLPNAIPDLADVGFPLESTWKQIVSLRQGLVIVTGVTGSGKSTTVASLLQHINENQKLRIITLEDPIEYVLPSDQSMISQRELGVHIERFDLGLRSALREDPDVIFVGEIRDQETAQLALTAAETGHLVVSTLHTRDTRGAITRLVDLFPAERGAELSSQLSFALSYVLGQKLVARADGNGRRVAMEVLRNVPAIGNLIRTGNWHSLYSAMQTNLRAGVVTLERHLADLVQSGEITRDEAIARANDSSQFKS